jgi:hypothetical protein
MKRNEPEHKHEGEKKRTRKKKKEKKRKEQRAEGNLKDVFEEMELRRPLIDQVSAQQRGASFDHLLPIQILQHLLDSDKQKGKKRKRKKERERRGRKGEERKRLQSGKKGETKRRKNRNREKKRIRLTSRLVWGEHERSVFAEREDGKGRYGQRPGRATLSACGPFVCARCLSAYSASPCVCR